jgi:hypothetical protein
MNALQSVCEVYRQRMEVLRLKREERLRNPPPPKLTHAEKRAAKKARKRQQSTDKPRPKHHRPAPLTYRPKYDEYMRSKTWKKVRLWRIELAVGKCEKCGGKNGLEVHHLTYERIGAERKEDLQVLCDSCHKHSHHDERLAIQHLQSIQREA